MKPLVSWDAAHPPKVPKPRVPVKKRNAKRGGSRFPKRRDLAYMRWCLEELERGVLCDMCGQRRANARAHVIPRSRGGADRDNIVFSCQGPGSNLCHERSEKRAEAFCAETGVHLFAIARDWTLRYEREKELPF